MLCCMLNLSVKQQLCLDRWLFGWSTFFVVVVVVVARNVFLWPAPALPTKSEPNGVGRNYLTIACLGIYICGTVHRNSRLKKANEMQQYADIYLLLNYSTCFGRSSRPSSGVHKTVVATSGTNHTIWGASFFKRDHLVTFEEACSPDSMICTRGCNYSFMYSWWWARWTPETCRVM